MNILINLKSSAKSTNYPFHGGNEYCNSVSAFIIFLNSNFSNKLFFYCDSENQIDNDLLLKIKNDLNSQLLIANEVIDLNLAVKKFQIDRVFDPLGANSNLEKLVNVDVEVIYTIHGLRPLELPSDINEFYLENKLKYILKFLFYNIYKKYLKYDLGKVVNLAILRNKIIVVSNHTKSAILSEYNVNPDNIIVYYSPEKIGVNIDNNSENHFFNSVHDLEPSKYFLMVSTKRWVKNSYRAIKAFDELINQGILKNKVVLVGANNKVTKLIKNKEWFCILDYVKTEELEILYKNAFALIYPTLNEGFGYPPLEAMKYGTPVLSSMITSIPEIVGDAALGFNPFSVLEIKSRIIRIENDNDLYLSLKAKGIARYDIISKKQKGDLIKLANSILD